MKALTVRRFIFAVVVGLLLSFAVVFSANAQPRPWGPGSPEYELQKRRDDIKQAQMQFRVAASSAGVRQGSLDPSVQLPFGVSPIANPFLFSGGVNYFGFDPVEIALLAPTSFGQKGATIAALGLNDLRNFAMVALYRKFAGKPEEALYAAEKSGFVVIVAKNQNAEVYVNGGYVGVVKDVDEDALEFKKGKKVKIEVRSAEQVFKREVRILPGRIATIITPF